SAISCPDGRVVSCPNTHPSEEEMEAACGMSSRSSSSASAGSWGTALGEAIGRLLFGSPKTNTPSSEDIARQQRLDAAYAENNRGIAEWNQHSWGAAVEHFERSLEFEPADPVVQTNLARAREQLRRQLE